MAAVAISALVGAGFAFRSTPANNVDAMNRWNRPASANDNSGLGSGLTYFIEPDFCTKMFPSFDDRQYIWCRDIQASILRAFVTWSSNHPDIRFMNATDVCLKDIPFVNCFNSPPTVSTTTGTASVDRGNCTKLCAAAEIYIIAQDLGTKFEEPARVQFFKTVGFDSQDPALLSGPTTTSGAVVTRDSGISRAVITFNTAQCVYMDSYFCPGMHRLETAGTSVHVLFSFLMMPLFAIALVAIGVRSCMAVAEVQKNKDRGVLHGTVAAVHKITTPIWISWAMISLAILAPYVYFSIVAPCVKCYDFEASMVHYVGEVLGLADPEKAAAQSPSRNYKMGTDTYVNGQNQTLTRIKEMTASTCTSDAIKPLTDAGSMVLPVAFDKALTFANESLGPVMLTPKRNRAPRCPTLDDLQGLNMLYPTCELSQQTMPQCVTSTSSLGILRFAGSVAFSMFVAFMALWFVSWVTAFYLRRLDSLPLPETKKEKRERDQAERDAEKKAKREAKEAKEAADKYDKAEDDALDAAMAAAVDYALEKLAAEENFPDDEEHAEQEAIEGAGAIGTPSRSGDEDPILVKVRAEDANETLSRI